MFYLKPMTIQDGRLSVISQGNVYLRPITIQDGKLYVTHTPFKMVNNMT